MNITDKNNVKQFYDNVGNYFSHTRKWLWPEMLPYINRLKENDTVLDIGCGNGRLLNGISKNISYVGVDFSKLLLSNAKKLHPNHNFLYGDILSNKIWDKLPMADAIFCVAVLHHVSKKDMSFLFTNLSKKLKPGGFLYISSWNLWQKKYLKYHLSLKSIISKVKDCDFRSVWVPFQNKNIRYCKSYLLSDIKILELNKNNSFISSHNSYLLGKNLVVVFEK